MAHIIDSYSPTIDNSVSLSGHALRKQGAGQSFTGDGSVLDSCVLALSKNGSPTGSATVNIYAHTGTYGTSSVPTGSVLATATLDDVSTLAGGNGSDVTINFVGGNRITLENGTHYCVVILYSGGALNDIINLMTLSSSPTHPGNVCSYVPSTWSPLATSDARFMIYGIGSSPSTSISSSLSSSPSQSISSSVSNSPSSSPSSSISISPSTSISLSPSTSPSISISSSVSSSPSISISSSPSTSVSSSISASPSQAAVTEDSYSETNVDAYYSLSSVDNDGVAQAFTGNDAILKAVSFYVKRTGSPTGNIYAKLYGHTGVFGTSGKPSGDYLAISEPLDLMSIGTSPALIQFNFSGVNKVEVGFSYYTIALEYSGGDGSNYYQVGYDSSAPSHAGNASTLNDAAWTSNSNDVAFYLLVDQVSSISSSPSSSISHSVSTSPSVSSSISSSPSTSRSSSVSSSPSTSVSSSISASPSSSISASPSPSTSVSSSPSTSISSSPSSSLSASISSSISSSPSPTGTSPSTSLSSSVSSSLSSSISSSPSSSPSPSAQVKYRSIGRPTGTYTNIAKPNQPLYRDIKRPL